MRDLKYLITGTGRCGTVYLSRLLTSIGMPCGHESIFGTYGLMFALRRMNGLDPCYNSGCSILDGEQEEVIEIPESESSYLAAPYLSSGLFHQGQVIHLVRHPLVVINSFVNGLRYFHSDKAEWIDSKDKVVPCGYHRFIYQYVPELSEPMTAIERAALYYVRWNQMIEKFKPPGTKRIRLEDCPGPIFDILEIEPPKTYYQVLDSNRSPSSGKSVSIADIPLGKIRFELTAMAEKYGYRLHKVFV